jgi:hypothetical protein
VSRDEWHMLPDGTSMGPVTRPAFDVAAARARCEAATPGPWGQAESVPGALVAAHAPGMNLLGTFTFPDGEEYAVVSAKADAAFIAAARQDLPAALDEIEALREDLADARTSALEEAARIADTYCGDGVALDQWTPHGHGERTREDIAREIRAAISAPRVDPRDAEIEALKARLTAILDMLDAEEHDLAQHLAEKARALA